MIQNEDKASKDILGLDPSPSNYEITRVIKYLTNYNNKFEFYLKKTNCV